MRLPTTRIYRDSQDGWWIAIDEARNLRSLWYGAQAEPPWENPHWANQVETNETDYPLDRFEDFTLDAIMDGWYIDLADK